MEFERAIFRVYERCVEGLRDDENDAVNSKSCRVAEFLTLTLGLFFLATLLFLHFTFVGHAGCLPELLEARNASVLKKDQILRILIDKKFAPEDPGVTLRSGADDGTTGVRRLRTRNLIGGNLNQHRSLWVGWAVAEALDLNMTTSNGLHSRQANISKPIYDYEFAYDIGILALPEEIKISHKFEIINVTMSGSKCFGNAATRALLPLGGLDTVVLNNVINTVKKPGILIAKSGDYYTWQESDIVPYDSAVGWLVFKISVLLLSLSSFFLMSTTTALLVRVLISSGVVLLFPFFWFLQSLFGINVISAQIIRLSYPWIGVPMELMRARNQSAFPFLLAHTTRVVLYYVFYEACQIAFSMWLYGEARPGQRELWLFAIMMLWEYFSMIYVRSSSSIQLFPRASLAIFLLYHFYLYSQPQGFHVLALLVAFLFLTAMQIFCVRKFEYEAYFRGDVNIDQPRMLYNTVAWPTWPIALAPDFTLFMPITERATNIYQHIVPPVQGEDDGNGAGSGAGAGAGDATAASGHGDIEMFGEGAQATSGPGAVNSSGGGGPSAGGVRGGRLGPETVEANADTDPLSSMQMSPVAVSTSAGPPGAAYPRRRSTDFDTILGTIMSLTQMVRTGGDLVGGVGGTGSVRELEKEREQRRRLSPGGDTDEDDDDDEEEEEDPRGRGRGRRPLGDGETLQVDFVFRGPKTSAPPRSRSSPTASGRSGARMKSTHMRFSPLHSNDDETLQLGGDRHFSE